MTIPIPNPANTPALYCQLNQNDETIRIFIPPLEKQSPKETFMCPISTDAHHRGRPKNKT